MTDVGQVIPVVMGIIIAGTLLILGFKVIGQSSLGIENIWKTGQSQTNRMNPVDMYTICSDWLSAGSQKYNSKEILETYKIHELMKPYDDLRACCGELIEDYATECYSGEETRHCAGDGYVQSDEVSVCINACSNIIKTYELCHASCADDEVQCFEGMIQVISRPCNPNAVDSNMIESACSGKLLG